MSFYRYISIHQKNIKFKYIIDALNQCFGKNYTSYRQGRSWYFNHIDDDTMVWFPKITNNIDAKWRNNLLGDGKRIVEESSSNSSSPNDALPRITFAKFDDSGYQFIGVFIIDEEKSFPGHKEYTRICDYVDLRTYNTRIDNRDLFSKILFLEQKDRISSDTPFFAAKEGYKRRDFKNGHRILFENINKDTSPSEAASVLKKAVNSTSNLVHKQQIVGLGNEIEKNPIAIGNLTKQLVLSDADQKTFEGFVSILGAKYDLISFIFFIKDCNKYIPVRPRSMDEAFKRLKYDFKMEGYCSWDNYNTYIKLCREILFQLNNIYEEKTYDLLDAQSLLWVCGHEDKGYFDSVQTKSSVIINKKANESLDNRLVASLKEEKQFKLDLDANVGKVVLRKQPRFDNGRKVYPRSKRVARNALILANHNCEIDGNHTSFIRRGTSVKYMEPHHLVPMSLSDEFECSLDREENIVCLCSNCHNRIHYGDDAEKLVRVLFEKRKEKLLSVGIDIGIDELLKAYV